MKPTPKGWPRISCSLYYQDASKAIDWLCSAFGFEVRLKVEGEGGRIEHSELVFGDGLIMVSDAGRAKEKGYPGASPKSLNGANTINLMVYVDDAIAHCERARKAGAKILMAPADQFYGDRAYRAEDPEGHIWYFGTYRPGAHWDNTTGQSSPA